MSPCIMNRTVSVVRSPGPGHRTDDRDRWSTAGGHLYVRRPGEPEGSRAGIAHDEDGLDPLSQRYRPQVNSFTVHSKCGRAAPVLRRDARSGVVRRPRPWWPMVSADSLVFASPRQSSNDLVADSRPHRPPASHSRPRAGRSPPGECRGTELRRVLWREIRFATCGFRPRGPSRKPRSPVRRITSAASAAAHSSVSIRRGTRAPGPIRRPEAGIPITLFRRWRRCPRFARCLSIAGDHTGGDTSEMPYFSSR